MELVIWRAEMAAVPAARERATPSTAAGAAAEAE
jgi:hypothetical protein